MDWWDELIKDFKDMLERNKDIKEEATNIVNPSYMNTLLGMGHQGSGFENAGLQGYRDMSQAQPMGLLQAPERRPRQRQTMPNTNEHLAGLLSRAMGM